MKLLGKIFILLCIPTLVNAAETTEILVLDATIKNKVIENAEVIFQKDGETSIKAKTDSDGKVKISTPFGEDKDNVMMIIKADGFSPLAVKCPCNDLTYAISPKMKNLDGMRVVLTWGQYPEDLDSHLVFKNNHVFYTSKTGQDANLDVDDRDSYGPETITITKKKQGEKYYYGVHDFTNRENKSSKNLAESGAKVFVYIGSTLIKTYDVPNENGTVWAVFYVDENGEIVDVNKMSYESDAAYLATLLPIASENPDIKLATEAERKKSQSLNMKGEKEYHAGNLDAAIELYQAAIEQNPSNGQAYSNLGLAFQKNGNEAEAIWANRKAIALANGKNKDTVQASSYYNIAKIYEQKEEYEDALQNYKWALEKKDRQVYKDAIKRMEDKL